MYILWFQTKYAIVIVLEISFPGNWKVESDTLWSGILRFLIRGGRILYIAHFWYWSVMTIAVMALDYESY